VLTARQNHLLMPGYFLMETVYLVSV